MTTQMFRNFIENIDWTIAIDAIVGVLAACFFMVVLIRKRNVRLLFAGLIYVAAFATLSTFCYLSDGKRFFVAVTVMRYVLYFLMFAFCVVYQSDIKVLFSRFDSKGDDVHYATHGSSEDDLIKACNEIVKATQELSKNNIGALIVICCGSVPVNVVETGTRLNCVVSNAILDSIFHHNSPLHDGAVIIKNNTILSAGCFLPLTQRTDLSRDLGTRHRAAIGIAEESNVLSVVVSEESGIISVVKNKGEIKRYMTSERLYHELEEAFGITHLSNKKRK